MKMNRRSLFWAAVVATAVAAPALAYEYPLSSQAIREAYLLGTGPKANEADFYAGYWRTLPIPKDGPPVSLLTVDTPYLQVAEHSRDTANYSAQQAVRDFLGKPARFRVFLDIYFGMPTGSDPSKAGDVKIKLSQHGKELIADSVERWQLNVYHDPATWRESVGQHVQVGINAGKIDSSVLSIEVETPDGRQDETSFDLAKLK